MFLVNTGICPSLEKKSPRPTSFNFTTLGSYWICSGAETTSAPVSMRSATVIADPVVVFTTGGRNRTDAVPAGLAGSAEFGEAAVAGGVAVSGGAVAGGAAGTGAVGGGAVGAALPAG